METTNNQLAKESMPFIIQIKNVTDEKIYDVPLFDEDYNSSEKIQYSASPGFQVGDDNKYKDVLEKLYKNTEKQHFVSTVILLHAHCEFYKFKQKQLYLNCSIIDECDKEDIVPFAIDPYQMQDNLVKASKEIVFNNKTNIILPFLMPETTVKLFICPTSLNVKNFS